MNHLPGTRSTRRRRLLAEQLEDRRLLAGPYAPAAGEIGSDAIGKDDAAIIAWATKVANYTPGSNVDAQFQTPDNALGPATGDGSDVVSLGRGGEITLTFAAAIRDGLGPDFAVFENSFSDTFLELGFVEVSSDGSNFFRFDNDSLTPAAIDAFGALDPTEINNLAGKYRQGFGTPFDLEELAGVSPLLDLSAVTHVRLIDIVGDGSQSDSDGDPIFDPFPTTGSAGLDVDAIAVIHQAEFARDVVGFEDVGASLAAGSAFRGPDPNGSNIVGPFDDNVVVGSFQSETLTFNNAFSTDFESWTGWAYSNATNTTTPGFENQFSSFAGGGANGSPTFGIGFPDQSDFFGPSTMTRDTDDSRRLQSLMITNTTYAALSMRDGDSFAKKFGGVSGNDPDFLLLTITGKDQSGTSLGDIEFYLADFRFADNTLDYIVDQWVEVDLSSIQQARSLEFTVTSSDVGPFGINTPAFFAVDEITLVEPALPLDIADREVSEGAGDNATKVRISRPDSDTTAAIDISIAPVSASDAVVPTAVTIPAGERFVEFPIAVVNNDVVDGDRAITIEASADGLISSSRTLTIRDDDVRTLTLALGQSSLDEGNSLTATLGRNDADLSSPLTIQVQSSDPSRLSFNGTVTILAGQATAPLFITAIDDQIDRPSIELSLSASATAYVGATAMLQVNDNDQAAVTIEAATSYSESDAAPSAGLEDVGKRLPPESFDNGENQAGGFSSQGIVFNNEFDANFGSWSGWSYSNTTDTTTPGFTNQYSAIAAGGATGSDTYAVATAFSGALVPSVRRDPLSSDGFQSIEITNTTYAALSMMQGDAFAKKFGGVSGDDPDFFLLTIEGLDGNETSLGTIDFYLADFRSSDNSLDYIVDQWTTVDLSSLASSVELRFSLTSSDVGSFGMNTPAYFAADNIVLARQTPPPSVTVRRNTLDVSEAIDVSLSSSDPNEATLPARATIPAGASSITIPLTIFDDAVVDGDKVVTLGVSAASHDSASLQVTIGDDDVAALSLSILTGVIGEADGDVGQAVLHRNVEDTSGSLSVDLSAIPVSQVTLPSPLTIPVGQRSLLFTFAAQDNSIVDEDRTVSVQATADGFLSAQDEVSIVNDDVPPPTLTLQLDASAISESDAPPTILLEDIGATVAAESFNNGADLSGGFRSGDVHLNNTFDPTFGSWGGWSLSNTTDAVTPGFQNQYSAITAGGANGSATYAVASAFPGGTVPSIEIVSPQVGQSFQSLMVTNTTYAALSMGEGDAFAKKFGGTSGNDPDFFLLSIDGRDENDLSVGTVEFYLADFRFDDNSQDYIVNQWTTVDVSSLIGATRLQFSLSSSDVGIFGMNTPAYFAVDNIILSDNDPIVIGGTVTRSDTDLSMPLTVHLDTDDFSEAVLPASVVIPSGSSSTTFAIQAVDDALVDGPQIVQVTASSTTHTPSSASLTVDDDDVPSLTISLSAAIVPESAGSSATELLVHRNTEDVSLPLAIQLAATGTDIELPTSITIPQGRVSLAVPLNTVDNLIHDGDRTISIEASAVNFASASVSLTIIDDEVAALVVTHSDDETTVSELLEQDSFQVSLASQPLSNVFVDVIVISDDLRVVLTRLDFAPDQWDQPQSVTVEGVPDLRLENDQIVVIRLSVDTAASDPSFTTEGDTMVDVLVLDYQPSTLRLGEDNSEIFLVDEDSGVRFLRGNHRDGLHAVANDLDQTIRLDALTRSRGLVQVDAQGGDDTVIVAGTRFTSLMGGQGYDKLVLKLDVRVELVEFLDSRVIGFEEVVVASDTRAELQIDVQKLPTIVAPDESLLVRVEADQNLTFRGDAQIISPVMVGDDFAQVVRADQIDTHVISPTPWRNVLSIWDVNHNGSVTSLDALAVINQISRTSDPVLPALTSLSLFAGAYFDVSGDGLITSLDALQVINEIARRLLSFEGEASPIAAGQAASSWDRFGTALSVISENPSTGLPIISSSDKVALFSTPHDEAIRQLFWPVGEDSQTESSSIESAVASEVEIELAN